MYDKTSQSLIYINIFWIHVLFRCWDCADLLNCIDYRHFIGSKCEDSWMWFEKPSMQTAAPSQVLEHTEKESTQTATCWHCRHMTTHSSQSTCASILDRDLALEWAGPQVSTVEHSRTLNLTVVELWFPIFSERFFFGFTVKSCKIKIL